MKEEMEEEAEISFKFKVSVIEQLESLYSRLCERFAKRNFAPSPEDEALLDLLYNARLIIEDGL